MVSDTVADIAFRGVRTFAVEVVVTHEPEPETLARYEGASIPVFLIRPSWETIDALRDGIDASEALFTDSRTCRECVALAQARERREASERRRQLQEESEFRELMAPVLAALARRRASATTEPWIHRWVADASGRPMPDVEIAVRYQLARKLVRLGFRQSADRPWLLTVSAPDLAVFRIFLGAPPHRRDKLLPVTLSWSSSYILHRSVAEGVIRILKRAGVEATIAWRMHTRSSRVRATP